jgi:hypothetical protein
MNGDRIQRLGNITRVEEEDLAVCAKPESKHKGIEV